MMPITSLLILVGVFFVATAIGVVTGSNSLVTVPLMFELGMEPKRAIATNMFGLTFMAIGATIPFYRKGLIDTKKLAPYAVLTVIGSACGALLVGVVKSEWIPLIVSISMFAIVGFTLLRRDVGVDAVPADAKPGWRYLSLVLAFFLSIYGGFFSGGYMTVLTAVFVAFGGMTFSHAIAGTKYLNLFSSGIATLIFMWQGLVDYKLGAILAITMFAAAYVGAEVVSKINNLWLKRIFLAVVLVLAVRQFI